MAVRVEPQSPIASRQLQEKNFNKESILKEKADSLCTEYLVKKKSHIYQLDRRIQKPILSDTKINQITQINNNLIIIKIIIKKQTLTQM